MQRLTSGSSGRARAALLLLCGLIAPLALCAGCEEDEPEPPPLALRAAMFEIEFARREIEPHVRNPERLPQTVAALDRIAELVEDPSFEGWTDLPSFRSDPQLFGKFRNQLRKSTRETRDAAQAGDLDGLREGFSRMNMTCVACHKRFQPNY